MTRKRGAPVGNVNGMKKGEWEDAIHYALANYEAGGIQRGKALKCIAKKLVEKALDGDKDAIAEIGNRLDGKPKQAIEGTGNGLFIVQISSSDANL